MVGKEQREVPINGGPWRIRIRVTLDGETFACRESPFMLAGQNFFLPPGTPKDRAQILQDAMRKTLSDPEFSKEY